MTDTAMYTDAMPVIYILEPFCSNRPLIRAYNPNKRMGRLNDAHELMKIGWQDDGEYCSWASEGSPSGNCVVGPPVRDREKVGFLGSHL